MTTVVELKAKYPWITDADAAAILRSTSMNASAGTAIDPLNLSPMSVGGGDRGIWKGLSNPNYELPKADSGLFGMIDKMIPDSLGGAALMFGGLAGGLGGLESLGLGGGGAGVTLGDTALGGFYGGLGEGVAGALTDLPWGVNPGQSGLGSEAQGAFYGDLGGTTDVSGWAIPSGIQDQIPQINTQLAELGLPTVDMANPTTLSTILSKITPGQWLSTGGSVLAGLLGYSASQAAAKALSKGAEGQQGLLKYMYDQNRADLEPWRKAGVGALGNLVNLTTPGKQLDTAMLDPGYAFRQSEGEKGINRAAAARGLWDSGPTYKALDRYNQNYATGEFGNVYNRNANLAGLGQTATNTGVQAGQNYAQNAGESMLQAANARASGYMGGANAIGGSLASIINNYNQNEMLDKLIAAKYRP